jgi:6-phosphogluconate dehydrogenase (decarboxylating)
MGINTLRLIMRDGHRCAVYDLHAESVPALVKEGA